MSRIGNFGVAQIQRRDRRWRTAGTETRRYINLCNIMNMREVGQPHDREGLESLCNYLCRPAFAASRLEQLDDGMIPIALKNIWKGGVIAVFLSAYELVVRVLAQIPLPFCPSLHFHGCFSGNTKMRANVVPAGNKPKARRKKSLTEKRRYDEDDLVGRHGAGAQI